MCRTACSWGAAIDGQIILPKRLEEERQRAEELRMRKLLEEKARREEEEMRRESSGALISAGVSILRLIAPEVIGGLWA